VVGRETIQPIQMRIPHIQNVLLMHVDALVERAVVHRRLKLAALQLRHILQSRMRHRLWLKVRSPHIKPRRKTREKRSHVVQHHLHDAELLSLPLAQRLESTQLQTRAHIVSRPLIGVAI
jgi:hypothetical protein